MKLVEREVPQREDRRATKRCASPSKSSRGYQRHGRLQDNAEIDKAIENLNLALV